MATEVKPIILVVDPDPLTMMGLSATLFHQGAEVHGARTPVAALKAAAQLALDLVVVDGWIDQGQGIELVHSIRQLSHLPDVPAIFLWEGTSPAPTWPHSAFSLRKPLDLEVLVTMVQRALWLPHLVHPPAGLRGCNFLKERSISHSG
jgi:CheY-like chemotaxis protein